MCHRASVDRLTPIGCRLDLLSVSGSYRQPIDVVRAPIGNSELRVMTAALSIQNLNTVVNLAGRSIEERHLLDGMRRLPTPRLSRRVAALTAA
jgi:hypothetical protein